MVHGELRWCRCGPLPSPQPIMSIYDQHPDHSPAKFTALEQEVAKLKGNLHLLDIQNKMLKGFISLTNVSAGRMLVKATLQKILEASMKQTHAELGSLFLLDGQGRITEAILARGATDQSQKQDIVGQVLEKGLAGWVMTNQRAGLVTDTSKDYRWVKLPHEPYQARSALGVPIIWGDEMLGILTLMHEEVEFFNENTARGMEKTAELFALILNNARLQSQHKQQEDAVQREDDLLNQAVRFFPSIVLIFDAQGQVVKCGGRHLEDLGLTPKSAVGRSIYQLLPEGKELVNLVSHALGGSIIEAVDCQLSQTTYSVWCSPVLARNGQVSQVICLLLPA